MTMNDYLHFSRRNGLLFVLGLISIIAGYLGLRLPPADNPVSLTFAPLLLILGYCVLIPLSLLIGIRSAPSAPSPDNRK